MSICPMYHHRLPASPFLFITHLPAPPPVSAAHQQAAAPALDRAETQPWQLQLTQPRAASHKRVRLCLHLHDMVAWPGTSSSARCSCCHASTAAAGRLTTALCAQHWMVARTNKGKIYTSYRCQQAHAVPAWPLLLLAQT